MVPVTVDPATLKWPTRLSVAMALALSFGPVAGQALPSVDGAPASPRRIAVGQGASGQQPQKGEVRYQAVDRDGATRTLTVASPYEREVIVKLTGHPLADEWRAARSSLLASDAGAPHRRLRHRMPAYVAQAAERLRIQHSRVEGAIARFAAQARKAHGESGGTKIRYRYTRAFNGLALRASAEVLERLRRHPDVEYVRPAVKVEKALAESTVIVGFRVGPGRRARASSSASSTPASTMPTRTWAAATARPSRSSAATTSSTATAIPAHDNGHGTHVAGIVAANGGVKGVAPDARIVAYKVLEQLRQRKMDHGRDRGDREGLRPRRRSPDRRCVGRHQSQPRRTRYTGRCRLAGGGQRLRGRRPGCRGRGERRLLRRPHDRFSRLRPKRPHGGCLERRRPDRAVQFQGADRLHARHQAVLAGAGRRHPVHLPRRRVPGPAGNEHGGAPRRRCRRPLAPARRRSRPARSRAD